MRDVAITFKVDPSHTDEVSIDYLPFGTRVLKIKVVNTAGPTDVPLVLRPANTPVQHEEAGPLAGCADDQRDIWVVWGGGHERGPCAHGRDISWQEVCAPLDRGASSYTYLHVTHRPDTWDLRQPFDPSSELRTGSAQGKSQDTAAALSDATVTLFVMAGEEDDPVGRLRINLRAPRVGVDSSIPVEDPVRPVWVHEESGGRIEFEGSQIPTYLSRWWSEPRIRYDDASVPNLSIHYRPVSESATWPWLRLWRALGMTLVREPGRVDIRLSGQPIMMITGNIEPALFHDRWMLPEVYRFYSSRYAVLRLWFLWLDMDLGVVRRRLHEVPDIERFDVLIDLEEEKAVYACTDLHWREMWGAVLQQPIKSHIGLSAGKLLRLLGERLEDEFFDLLVILDETEKVVRNPAVRLCEKLTGHAHCDHDVATPEGEVAVRGAGLYAKHAPYFDDETVKLDGRLTSGDVRRT
ncbi:MAG: hypothetical protein ACE5LU_26030 [Anaerolineae bacterium]